MKPVFNMLFGNLYPMKKSVSRLVALIAIVISPILMSMSNVSTSANTESASSFYSTLFSESLFSNSNTSNFYSSAAAEQLYNDIHLSDYGLGKKVFSSALKGFDELYNRGLLSNDSVLTIIDFTKSSSEKRLYVIDLKTEELAFNTVVAHGKKSGSEFARSFSNKPKSKKSSLGFFVTANTYEGSNGYSLKLKGCERGINDRAMERAIVMHGADYVSEEAEDKKSSNGRSFGCPAVPEYLHKDIIDKIKNGNCLFIYYPDRTYLKKSKILNG